MKKKQKKTEKELSEELFRLDAFPKVKGLQPIAAAKKS